MLLLMWHKCCKINTEHMNAINMYKLIFFGSWSSVSWLSKVVYVCEIISTFCLLTFSPFFNFLIFWLSSSPSVLLLAFWVLQLFSLSWLFGFLLRLLFLLSLWHLFLWLFPSLSSFSWLHLLTQLDHLLPQHFNLQCIEIRRWKVNHKHSLIVIKW